MQAPAGSAPLSHGVPSTHVAEGLEGIVAAESRICFVDGVEGRLIYQGYDIHDLAAHAGFEEVLYLLWHGDLPARAQLDALNKDLIAARTLPEPVMNLLRSFPRAVLPMDALRTATSALGIYDPDSRDNSAAANLRKSVRLTAQTATIVAAIGRCREGRDPVAPDPSLSHAANFLQMLWGRQPDDTSVKTIEIALILHADHELNASTFAARVTAATLADMHSAITSAIGTLKGPLHGGANEAVMRLLLSIGDPANVIPTAREMLAAKKKIPGFGHRVYKTEDPRATHLRKMSEELGRRKGELKWFEMSRALEQFMLSEKKIYANVDFYSATSYYYLGIPLELFTPVFAASRISGWTAHVLEQLADNRIIRPRAEYVGPRNRTYVPINRR
ncbi:MAG TPA: citrate synthase [bacterium]|nr:citrate synthase [bacterium]